MAGDYQEVSLASMAAGAVVERFDYEFSRVIENIADPNTTLDAREIVLTVKVAPNKSRTQNDLTIKCKTKLASTEPLETTVFVSMTKLGLVASEYKPKQADLFDEMESSVGTNVTPFQTINGGKSC